MQVFSNNIRTELATAVTSSDTTIVVMDATGMPTLGTGDTFKITVENGIKTVVEIMTVTAVVGNTLTVVRGQEGTAASTFDALSVVEMRLTAGWMNQTETKVNDLLLGKQNTITGAASSVVTNNLNANVVVTTDASGKLTHAASISTTELGYLDGVTSSIQTQLNSKEPTITTLPVSKGGTGVGTLTGLVKGNGTGAMTAAVAGTDYVIPSGSITGNAATATTLQTARTINGVSFNGSANITIADSTKIPTTEKGTANGVATLGSDGKVPSTQLPSYVDDVLEFTNLASFPATGESGKIYVALDTNKTYRWSGTAYIYITSGAVDTVAGKTGVVTLVKADVGLSNVDNTSDANKPISTATQTALNLKAPLVSPALTGIPTAPTAAVGTNTTQLATTAFVEAATQEVKSNSIFGFKNHIINGNFDIWQRGTSQTINVFGSDDRWANNHLGSTKTHSRVACTDTERVLFNASAFSRTIVNSVAGTTSYTLKVQHIEDVTRLAGKTVTLSFWAKADINKNIAVEFSQRFGTGGIPSADVTGIGSQLVLLATTWQKKTITVTLPSIVGKTLGTDGVHTTSIGLAFWFESGSTFNPRTANLGQQSGTFDIAQVQLEEGSVATPFEQRPYGLELSLCQRYFYHFDNYDALYRIIPVVSLTTIPFPVSMRTAPTVLTYRLEKDGVQQAINSGANIIQTNKEGVLFIVTSGDYSIADVMYFAASTEL